MVDITNNDKNGENIINNKCAYVDMESIVNNTLEEDSSKDREQTQESSDTDMDLTKSDSGKTEHTEIEEIAQELSTNISVIGCGGGGCNTINRIFEEGINEAELIAVNTDAQDLAKNKADEKKLIGREECQGRGAGSVPERGEKAAKESSDKIEEAVSGSDMVFITAGMGGGTGTGAAPVVAEIASKQALTIAIVTTPFAAEGEARLKNANGGLQRLREHTDTVIVVPNDRLLEYVPDAPLRKAFKICDEVLMRSVKGITELITEENLVNLDFADIRTIMKGGGVAMIGMGESDSSNRHQDSVKKALQSPLLDVNVDGASSVLVNVTGPEGMQISEAEGVVEHLNKQVSTESRIIWGAGIREELDQMMRTMVVITGVESPQIFGTRSNTTNTDLTTSATEQSSDDDSGIDYVE